MRIGILGLPGAGKSTLFDLLTETPQGSDATRIPGKPRLKVVRLEDPRLERLRDDYKPRKFTPLAYELVDFPPVAQADKSRGGIADQLAPARECDALFVVVRAFEKPGLPSADPKSELAEVRGELLLADLVLCERRIERLEEKRRKPSFRDEDERELALLSRIRSHLEAERPLYTLELTAEERKRTSGFAFLSAKPQVIVVNVGADRKDFDTETLEVREGEAVRAADLLSELEIQSLDPDERAAFLEEYGIREPSRLPLIALGYRAAGRISFFTAGEKEVRAWSIRKGTTAVEAAGAIHTDMARGFIRAEVVSFEDYERTGSLKAARDAGLLRLEGKEYIVQDGDIIEFRFSV